MYFNVSNANVGKNDRMIRAIVGLLLIASVLRGSTWLAGLIGVALLATAYFRFCPVYRIFDFATNKDEQAPVEQPPVEQHPVEQHPVAK